MKPAFPKIESRLQQVARQWSPLLTQTIRQYIGTPEDTSNNNNNNNNNGGNNNKKRSKILLKHLLSMKAKGERISMVTCYDYNQAKLADFAGIDTILVGDSCAQVMLGLKSTNQMSMDAMVHHTRSVSNGVESAYVIGDMPFGSYLTKEDAVRNASRIVGEGGANGVKLEGFIPDAVEAISKFVPVIGHLGLLPQTADCFGTRGRVYNDILQLKEESLRLQDAGCSMLVLEKVCAETTQYISQLLDIPTIGIASGVSANGQVLVWHDLLGLNNGIMGNGEFKFKFVKQYGDLAPIIINALKEYINDVKNGSFPEYQHSFFLHNKTKEKLKKLIEKDFEKHSSNVETSEETSDEESSLEGNLIDPIKFWQQFDEFYGNNGQSGEKTEININLKIPKISENGNNNNNNNNKSGGSTVGTENGTEKQNGLENGKEISMKIIESPKELREYRSELEKQGKYIIFVPFLGGLHAGHLELIKRANEEKRILNEKYGIECEIWTSLFLNPTQFNDPSDLANYPMIMEDDLSSLKSMNCVNVVFRPSADDMYKVKDSHFRPFVSFTSIYDKCEEAKQRKGHFEGVGTVVTKLFAWIRPQKAIFGQKDFMQSVLISRLCDEFFNETEMIVHPTVREESGLALSSRNRKLNEMEIIRAPMIYDCLCSLAGIILQESSNESGNGMLKIGDLKRFGELYCQNKGISLEYISFHEYETGFALDGNFDILNDFKINKNKKYVISIAASVGPSTRLIDNIVIANDWQILKQLKIPPLKDILENIKEYSTFYAHNDEKEITQY